MVMHRSFTAAVVGLSIGLAGAAYAMGGNLSQPSISVPVDAKTKKTDSVTQKVAGVLQAHRKEFTGGWFINAHSVLYFDGKTAGVNALLGDLAKVEGATIRVRLSNEVGVTRREFPGKDAATAPPCDCEVDHLGWSNARNLTVTVYLGGGRVDPAKLELPRIAGAAEPGK